MNLQQARQVAKETVKALFKDDYGNPYEMTTWQCDIFNTILTRKYPRTQIIAPRQSGKSDAISMALIIRSLTFKEKWAIVAGQKDKAMIIMNRVIQHTFDNEMFYKQLELDSGMALDRLRRERSKDHVTWRDGGSIQVFTADTRNKNRTKEALTGFGCLDKDELITTDVGTLKLGELVKNKTECNILSYNHETKKNEFKKIIEYQRNLLGDRHLLEVELSNGKKIVCTNDHPIFVKGLGYIEAQNIKQDMELQEQTKITMSKLI